jgi:hypothetical protein
VEGEGVRVGAGAGVATWEPEEQDA